MRKINGNKLRKKITKLLPYSDMDKDNEGQVIIYTGLKETKNGNYKETKDEWIPIVSSDGTEAYEPSNPDIEDEWWQAIR